MSAPQTYTVEAVFQGRDGKSRVFLKNYRLNLPVLQGEPLEEGQRVRVENGVAWRANG